VQDTNSAGRGTAGFQALNLNSSANPEFIWGGVGASGGGETSGNYQDWNISEYNYGVSNAANKSCFGSLENRTAICVNNSTGAATLPALATFNAGISLVSGPLYAAGSGGVLGQVLTSQGGSSPAWAYRFASFACTGAFASGATTASFYGLGGSATACNNTEGNSGYMMRGAGTLSKLKMRCGTTGINAASGAFTLYDAPAGTASSGGTSTGITVTYGLTPANSTTTDNTHTYTYADGDMIQIKGTTYATGETLADCSISFEY
jgi:hypothetical protein